MVRGGKAVRSKMDYILGTDRRLFMNVSVRDPRHNSDHYMVRGVLRGGTAKTHEKYIAGRRKVPMQVHRRPTREDELFGDPRVPMLFPRLRFQHGPPQIPEEFVLLRRHPPCCIVTFRLPSMYLSCALAVPPLSSPITM